MPKIDTFSEDVNYFLGGRQVAFKNVQDWKHNTTWNKTAESKMHAVRYQIQTITTCLTTKWHQSKHMQNSKTYQTQTTT